MVNTLRDNISSLRRLSYTAVLLSVIAIIVSGATVLESMHKLQQVNILPNKATNSTNSSSQHFGTRLTNINKELNSTELSVINNASMSYFETAGEMYLNGSIVNLVQAATKNVTPFVVGGKPSVIYLGSITCVFCGENRWAMALALSRFGRFSHLYKGYSAIQDSDVPTLYWSKASYNRSTVELGASYNSSYISFIVIEDTAPISGGFSLQPLNVIQAEVNRTGNASYSGAMALILKLGNFQGTPYTIWGRSQVGGADAVDFGNSMPTNSTLQLTYMTHDEVLNQLSKPNDQFAWTEYAAADLYISMTCGSINNTAPVCTLPAILTIEKNNGY